MLKPQSSAVEWYRDYAYNAIVIQVKYTHDGFNIFGVKGMISEQEMHLHPQLALAAMAQDLVNHLRVQFYNGPWEKIRKQIIEAVMNTEASIAPYATSPPRVRSLDDPNSYRVKARSEFEGVEGLDESLWAGGGGLI